MQVSSDTPRSTRTIGSKDGPSFEVSVPQPYAPGAHELTEGEASALNQTIAENLSNNLRKRLIEGVTEGEGESATVRQFTAEEAQAEVDAYIAEYEIGVRRAGSGERVVADPIEREARKLAKAKATAMIREAGGKPSDYDLGPIVDKIFDANRDLLMAEGAKIVKAAEKAAQNAAGGLSLEGVDLGASLKAAA